MRNFVGHVVVVGTMGDVDKGAGFAVHGLFGNLNEAQAFASKALDAFAASKKEYGDKAFPYGEPHVEVVPLVVGSTPVEAVDNWVYDPNFHDELV